MASAALFGLPTAFMMFAYAHNAIVVMAPLLFVNGFLMVLYNVNQISLRQAITPERLQGKMNATMRFLVWGVFPIGGILGGIMAEAIGLRALFLFSGIGVTISFLLVHFSPVLNVKSISKDGVEMRDGTSLA